MLTSSEALKNAYLIGLTLTIHNDEVNISKYLEISGKDYGEPRHKAQRKT